MSLVSVRKIIFCILLILALFDGVICTDGQSITKCIWNSLGKDNQCILNAGQYNDVTKINNLHGPSSSRPIVIKGDSLKKTVISGVMEVKHNGWQTDDGRIYKTKLPEDHPDIWQLFINDVMMTNARWPNSKWSDKSIFHGKFWSKMDKGSSPGRVKTGGYGKVVDSDLSQFDGKDLDGAMAILNIGSFNTFVGKVEDYGREGNGSFKFKDTFGKYHFKVKRCRYFLEDHIAFLDQPEEWFYERSTNTLYVYPQEGVDLNNKDTTIFGKITTYSLTIEKSSNILIQNLEFFATTLYIVDSFNITVDSCSFKFPSYSKRMLGDTSLIQWTKVDGESHNVKFINNEFYGSDGCVLQGGKGAKDMVIENNRFEFNDWSGANMERMMGGMSTVKTDGEGSIMRMNTLNNNGANVGLRPGTNSIVTMNRITRQCFGVIQNDGAGIQLQRKPQYYAQITHNWVFDSPKYGIRFDGQLPKIGTNGNMSYNVVWRCNGMMVKGDYHNVTNNLAFHKRNAQDSDGQGTGCMLCVISKLRQFPGIMNNHTEVCNNAADVANGGVNVKDRKNPLPFSAVLRNNLFNDDFIANDNFIDIQNFDFRPVPLSEAATKRIGPYNDVNETNVYWIPGREEKTPSFPIPPHKSQIDIRNPRDSLIWKNAYGCHKHRVFFGESRETMIKLGDVEKPRNMIELPSQLKNNLVYYWKVEPFCNDNGDLTVARKRESVNGDRVSNDWTRTRTIESQIWTFKTN
ncbi:uncharacterized protein [Clytia hemisphaerica]